MGYFDWASQFDISVNAMNDEHKKLMEIMNRLYDRNKAGADRAELLSIVNELVDYTVLHFSDEETYMASIQYPELATHKIIHKNLLKTLAEHVDKFKNGEGNISNGFFSFLRLWLSAHIQGIDMKYGTFSKTGKKAA